MNVNSPVMTISIEKLLVHLTTHEFHVATPTFDVLFMFDLVLEYKGPAFVAKLRNLCRDSIISCIV